MLQSLRRRMQRKERIAAREALEACVIQTKEVVAGEGDIFDKESAETEALCEETSEWLESNQTASKEEFEGKMVD